VRRIFCAHGLASIGSNLLLPSFFFYATQIFHWNSSQCLELVSAEGVVYIIGALVARLIVARLGRQRSLAGIQALLTIAAASAWLRPTPVFVPGAILCYTLVSAMGWPIFESLISAGAEPSMLSRRIGVYNLIWSGMGTLSLAISGTIINHFRPGMFLLPMAAHAIAALLISMGNVEPAEGGATGHAAAEPGLLRQRRLALQLGRIGLPASYTVLYSLVALMPSLVVIRSFAPASQTVVASIWMGSRVFVFIALGFMAWWHTRPRVLLYAAVAMLIAFFGVTLQPVQLLGGAAAVTGWDQILMIAFQIPLGLTMGMIYAGSLYFGMVLSEGSTEHGGYHEALIGLGQVCGPAAALTAEHFWPGDIRAAVFAVAAVLVVCLISATYVTIRELRRR